MKAILMTFALTLVVANCSESKATRTAPTEQNSGVTIPAPSPTPTPGPRPAPIIATPDDSLLVCYKSEGVEALHSCTLEAKELLPKQDTFSTFKVLVDYPCKGSREPVALSTDLGQRVVWNQNPSGPQTFTLYGKGPLVIEALEDKGFEKLIFQPGCYLRIMEATATPIDPNSL